MQTNVVRPQGVTAGSEMRTLVLASIGGALEFYDFVVFVFFTSAIAKLFFPASEPEWIRQTEAFGLFAAAYLARPLGGVVMAHFGDLRGRKQMFTLSISLMAIATLSIGLLPTYRSIGVAAPLLLLLMRLIQGAAIGGEAPAAWVFVAEHARPGRVGLAVGLLTGGLSSGIFLGSLMAAGINLGFNQAQIDAGVWRVPFLVGGVFGFIAMWMRRWLTETPVFEEMRRSAALSRTLPLRAVLKNHGRALVSSILCTWMLTAAIVVVILMTPSLIARSSELLPRALQLANLAATAALCVSAVGIGALTDRFGLRRVAAPILLLLIAATYGVYLSATHAGFALTPLYVLAGFGTGGAVLTPIAMVRAFPSEVRFSGVSFAYNVAFAVFGGLTPLLASWLMHVNPIGPAHYVAAAALIGLAAILLARLNWDKAGSDLAATIER